MMMTAFETTAERYRRRVFSFARSLLSNHEEAEEVTQDVLIRLWRHERRVDQERLGGWLLRVTRNACYDLLRRRRSLAAAGPRADEEEAAEVRSAEPDPEALLQAHVFRRCLKEALGTIGEPYRTIVLLREAQGLPHREISERLGIPEATVRVHLHRGRRRLREILGPEFRGGEER
jgi:RNA polymerase sigma-70 factor (ECF subfamily)